MKKFISIVTVFVLIFSFCSCGKKAEDIVKTDLINYVQVDLEGIKSDETEAIDRYNEISNQIETLKKSEIVKALKDEVIPTYSSFCTNLSELKPKTGEVKALLDTYVEGSSTQLQGLKDLVAAIEKNDSDAATKANETINQGRQNIEKHRNDMITLATEHGINFKSDSISTETDPNVTTDDTSDLPTTQAEE